MNLTNNFSLIELTSSETAVRNGIKNNPNEQQIAALKLLCEKVMQPLRDWYGKPINITSGYRSPALNKAIGGSTTSQHSKGEAIDFTVPKEDYKKVWDFLRSLEFDQIIWEFGNSNAPDWIHVSYSAKNNRKQALKAVKTNGKTQYLPK